MSMSDDPRDFRRGQGGGRETAPPRQGHGGRPAAPVDDRYEGYRQPEPPESRPPQGSEKPQPSFSAYRPEAYAKPETPPPGRSERPEWADDARRAPPPASNRGAPPQGDPYPRIPSTSQDPYYKNASGDPYASRSPGGYDESWEGETFRHSGAHQFPSYYPPSEDAALGADAQSVHDSFFLTDGQQDESAPSAGRRRPGPEPGFDDRDFVSERPPQTFANGAPAAAYPSESARRPHGGDQFEAGFDDGQFYDWDKFDQAPPPSSVRPFHAPAVADEDMDADFFADEDDYDVDDYETEGKGGRKKLMAAILIGAVAVGGGLAYVYKFSGEGGDGSPSIITADNTPVKEQPAEPGGRDFPNGSKLIYDRLGGAEDETSTVQLASGESSASAEPQNSAGSQPIPGIVTTGGTLEERIENALKAQGGDGQTPGRSVETADEPKTVKTVTFGPDGNPQPAQPRAERIAATDTNLDNYSSGVVVTTAQTASAGDDSGSASASEPPAQEQTQVAAVAPQQQIQTPEITESSGGTGNYFVQIGARNDREAAIAAFATLQQKYSSVIGNYSPSVRKADLGAKGVWYRLLVGPVDNKSDADALCQQLKGAGMKGCFSRKD